MNTQNIERIESGPAHLDKTAGSSFAEQQAYANSVRAQRDAFDVCDMAEEIDGLIVELAKDGQAQALGLILINRMNATIQRRAAWLEAA